MSEVLIGQSYYLRFDPKLWKEMQPYPPLGSLYAAAVVRDRGYEVSFFDAMLAESVQEWVGALRSERPRFAVLFEDNFNYFTKMCLTRMREAAFRMISAASAEGCTVIVCGSDPADHASQYLEAGADFILQGEGEETLAELLDALTGKAEVPLEAVSGLVFRRGHRLHRTSPRPVIKNLDALPFPAWDLIDMDRYRLLWKKNHGHFSMNMVTSRGCPFHCNWCAKPIWGQRYNARSAESVVEELKHLKHRYRPDYIWMMDDMMGIKPGWTRRFADHVQAEDARIPFKCLNRVDLLLRDGEIDALKDAGCDVVWTGVESGSQKVLDAMDKGITVHQIHEAAHRLHESGIRVGFFLQFGYPGETMEDIEATFRLVRECRPDQIGVSVSYPLPGTGFYEAVRRELGVKQNWTTSDDLEMMYRGPFSTDFYRKLHRVLHRDFRMRKAFRYLRASLADPRNWSRRYARELAAMVYHGVTLPVERLRLAHLARQSHDGIDRLPRLMSCEAAATPSPQ